MSTPSLLDRHRTGLDTSAGRHWLARLQRGIEKESLRVTQGGGLSRDPHPATLGSALTHGNITTDFSEAQLELITRVHADVDGCLAELGDIHRFVFEAIGDELMWATSMPCVLGGDNEVPVGRYGTSNIGRAKTIYRIGLAHRYGALMQTISGIHYNFSLPGRLWDLVADIRGEKNTQAFRTRGYFDLIRNFRRRSWLLIYLFGASPALCRSFLKDGPHRLEQFDEGSFYLPNATALRMGRLGYQSDAQRGLHMSYNGLAPYARTMREALTKPYPAYERIGVKVNGEYRQLSTSLIQIENEFYGTIRPKRRTRRGERPLIALDRRGVEYVEVRCLDLNPFLPEGIDGCIVRFVDLFLLHCLFTESPPDTPAESKVLHENQIAAVERGRDPDVLIGRGEREVPLREWAEQLLKEMAPLAELLDTANDNDRHSSTLAQQMKKVEDSTKTPSARILQAMRDQNVPFFRFAMNQSLAHKGFFLEHPLDDDVREAFLRETEDSLTRQREIEAADTDDFDTFLANYIRLPSVAEA